MDAEPAQVVLEASASIGGVPPHVIEAPGVLVGVRRSRMLGDGGAWSIGGWLRGQYVLFPQTEESELWADITVGIDYLFAGRPRHGPRLALGAIKTLAVWELPYSRSSDLREVFKGPTPLCDVSYAVEVVPARLLVVVGAWIAKDWEREYPILSPYLALRFDFAFGGSSKSAPNAPPPRAPAPW